MEHRPVDQLRTIADVHGAAPPRLSRQERLLRWAEILERDPTRRLKSLGEIEFVPRAEQPAMRADNSPLTVAFLDPVLREDGLGSDRLGDATAYFGLSERQAHRLLCSCLNGWSMEAGAAARKVRRLAAPTRLDAATVALAGASLATATLIYAFS